MYYVIFDTITKPVQVTDEYKVAEAARKEGKITKSRNDLGCMAEAKAMALHATELTGDKFVPVDNGEHHHPRYDFVRAPKVGDEVSYAFNGDYYPAGKVARVSDSLRVVTLEGGRKFYRRRETGSWLNNGTWSLVQGHVEARNPHI